MKHFLQSVLCATVILSAQSAWATDVAEIAIPTNSNLRVGVLRPGALLHSNREYTFPTVPDELNELAYTAHPHRKTQAVHLEVTKPGLLYLCIEGKSVQGNENILEKLGLTDWKKLDSKKSLGRPTRVGDSADWAVWSKQVKAGDKLSIPSVDRWGSIVCAAKITGLDIVVASSRGSSGSPTTVDKIEQVVLSESNEYDILKEQIAKLSDWNYERVEAEVFNSASLILPEDANPLEIVLRRTAALIADLKSTRASSDLERLAAEFENLKRQYKPTMKEDQIRELFDRVVAVRRQIAFTNPLLNFKDILFLKRRKGGGHMCDQYFAHKVPSGGGVFVLKDAFGKTPTVENLLAESTIQNGRLEGQYALDGAFVGLELSFDAKSIYFSRSEKQGSAWTPENSFNIYKASVDGSNLTLLTDGPTNDFDPCELPNGRLAFISERIGGYGRCHPRVVPTYTVHGMMADGSDIIPLSYHETNEWNPSVDNNGMIVYSRWDYVDRDSDIAHHIWHMFPDGRDPRSYHGNYPDERRMRPWMELSIRAIPDLHRYIATAAAHHGHNYGSLVMIDERIEDDRAMSQLKRITPEEGFPESEQKPGHMGNKRNEIYATAWPLSENYYICVYDARGSNYGIYLVDCFGNKELLYRDSKLPCFDPIPLVSRKRPPVIPIKTTQAAADRNDPRADLSMGTVTLMNVYEAEFPFPEGTQIKELRIVNIFPKSTPITNKPNIGKGAQSLCRGVLGTVPVEEDGSAHFEVRPGSISISRHSMKTAMSSRRCGARPTSTRVKRSVASDATKRKTRCRVAAIDRPCRSPCDADHRRSSPKRSVPIRLASRDWFSRSSIASASIATRKTKKPDAFRFTAIDLSTMVGRKATNRFTAWAGRSQAGMARFAEMADVIRSRAKSAHRSRSSTGS